MCLVEALIRFSEDFPAKNVLDDSFNPIIDIINYLFNSHLGTGTYDYSDSFYFQLFPDPRLDCSLINNNSLYCKHYGRNLVPERHEDFAILQVIMGQMPIKWPEDRLSTVSTIGELPIAGIFARLYPNLVDEEVRKGILTYLKFVEGKSQVEYASPNNEPQGDGSEFLLPVEINNFDDIKEELSIVKSKLKLRRLRFALMSWLSKVPIMRSLEATKRQQELFLERTFMSIMNIKEEREFEAVKFLFSKNKRTQCEVRSEINLLKAILLQEFIQNGIRSIKEEQNVISELLKKDLNGVRFSIDGFKGSLAFISKDLSKPQKKYMTDILLLIRTFVSQIKNRATVIQSEESGMFLIINLHDFNNSIYNWCKSVWGLQIVQSQTITLSERKSQQDLHSNLYVIQNKTTALKNELERTRNILNHAVVLEAEQRCNKKLYTVEQRVIQCQYWRERINAIEKRIRKVVMIELQKEVQDKVKQVGQATKEFNEYKETLMTQLRSEVVNQDKDISKEFKGISLKNSPMKSLDVREKVKSETKEASKCLRDIQEKIQKLRIFFHLFLLTQKRKYKDKISLLCDRVATNAQYHRELNLTEKREFLLKQELVRNQETINVLERGVRSMQNTLKDKNEALLRINQTKKAKSHRLIELEAKLKKYTTVGKADALVIQEELKEKDKELEELKHLTSHNESKAKYEKDSFQSKLKSLQKKLANEQLAKCNAIRRVERLLTKPKIDKVDNKSNIWYDKWKILLELCNTLKYENELLRGDARRRSKIYIRKHKRNSTQQFTAKIQAIGSFSKSTCISGTYNRNKRPGSKFLLTKKLPLRTEGPTERNSSAYEQSSQSSYFMMLKGKSFRNASRATRTNSKRALS